jgi:hypothetical protein
MTTYKAALALSGSNDDDYAEAQYWIGAPSTPFTRYICIILYVDLNPTPFIRTLHPSPLTFSSFLATYKAALALSGSNDDDYAEAQYWIGVIPALFTVEQ